MTQKQRRTRDKLHFILEEKFSIKIVSLSELTQNISKVSNVRVRERTISDYYELGIDAIDEKGFIKIPNNPKSYPSANASAIESQKLKNGDLIFGYRGKIGKIGLFIEETNTPVVTNNGMMKISFSNERLNDTPKYVQTYLSSKLIRTYLNSMLEEKNGKHLLSVETIETLPIPYFEEMGGFSKFSTILERRKDISIAICTLIDEAKALLQQQEDMENASISLQSLSTNELRKINEQDHKKQDSIKQLTQQLRAISNYQSSEDILSKDFNLLYKD